MAAEVDPASADPAVTDDEEESREGEGEGKGEKESNEGDNGTKEGFGFECSRFVKDPIMEGSYRRRLEVA